MTSIFDLKTNVDELSSMNGGSSRMGYDQHPPTRDVVGANFSNGSISFRFQTSGQKWWVPSRSYLRMRCSIKKPNNAAITLSDDVAPSMNMMPNMFQNMEMRISDKTVSRISNYVPQVDALDTRLSKSKSWIDSVGSSTNKWDADFLTRQANATSDGVLYNKTGDILQNPVTSRVSMGFDLNVGNVGTSNRFSYVSATGVLTYSRGTNAAGLATPILAYNVGDYFVFLANVDNTLPGNLTVAQINIPARITAVTAASITIETGKIIGDIPFDTLNNFGRIIVPNSSYNEAQKASSFELTWCPSSLSLFKVGHAMPGGSYELVMTPQTATSIQKGVVESLFADKNAADYTFAVVDFYLYVATIEGPRADDITYLLDLEQTRCQARKLTGATFSQQNFDVSPSTTALTVAYQDSRAGTTTRASSTRFKSYDNTFDSSEELGLNRFFINYASQSLPSPDADPLFVADVDYTIQRYTESLIYSGAMFDSGGSETLKDWHDRGAYYYFAWPRDGTDNSTRVTVNNQFAASTNMNLLLFDHFKQVAKIRVQDGRVVDVQLEDA